MNISLPGDFRYAMSKEPSRYAICGAEVRKADELVLVTVTDGRVLSMRLQNGVAPDAPTIIPGEMMPTLKGGGSITQTGENELRLVQGKKTLIGEVGVGAFPPCADILPEVTGVADLKVALQALDDVDGPADVVTAERVKALEEAVKVAQGQLRKSHVREVGVSGVLFHNLARSVNAGGGEGNLGVTLIIPMNPSQPMAVLPHGSHDVDSLGVIMPVNVTDGHDSRTWERRRKQVLKALKTAEEPE